MSDRTEIRYPARVIARLDIKGSHLIKGIHLEGLRKIGDPNAHALQYYNAGVDELIYMDAVASLYGRNHLSDIVRSTSENVFIPVTVGGGVRSVEDVRSLLNAGADKVAVNTHAIQRPELISEISNQYGSQCMVLSIEAKRRPNGGWEAFTDNGREHTGRDAVEWAQQGVSLGAGEILLTSVDCEGTRKGMDIALCQAISKTVEVPVILSGGAGTPGHIRDAFIDGSADAVAIADLLHYNRHEMTDIRSLLKDSGIGVR